MAESDEHTVREDHVIVSYDNSYDSIDEVCDVDTEEFLSSGRYRYDEDDQGDVDGGVCELLEPLSDEEEWD